MASLIKNDNNQEDHAHYKNGYQRSLTLSEYIKYIRIKS